MYYKQKQYEKNSHTKTEREEGNLLLLLSFSFESLNFFYSTKEIRNFYCLYYFYECKSVEMKKDGFKMMKLMMMDE